MKVLCKACKLEISESLIELKDLNLINKNDGQDYIPRGFYLIQQETAYDIVKGSIIINIKDLINSKRHSNRSRLNGCCGLDGCDGMNRVCLHNHEIATEYSDCWRIHQVIFNPELVELI
ncbi:hypothetical protein FCT18_08040 [Lysinibacillus sphaericus]|uniref:Uncharacterized protein n=3 Tax=Lysinibacillus TaxID=400634 RepID=A0A2S0JZ06_LYSSH|nr:hypothetical protein T479_14370 [Lysinibacillus varians]AVK96373.1 hypothetical protein LS41612_08970 [Lysinibacillus sphaericus]TKI50240.1 hypothetical protein FC748_03230 [Lysinibacillus tabacifolii]TKI19616.1 hypothetical protein FCT18_08040 [Lysinibacillus sphaericus]TKI65040.1 hypothetical protein FC752_09700 [Lysinibacillus varians]